MARTEDKANAARVKTKILAAAEILFADRGYSSVSMEEIAQQAKVTKSLIYYYFDSKKDVLRALYDRFEDDLNRVKDAYHALVAKGQGEISDRTATGVFLFLEKWKRTIKICLTEEISDVERGPLFDLLDKADASDEVKTASFFITAFPLIGYALMIDEWTEHMQTSKRRVREIVTPYLTRALEEIIAKNPASRE